MLLRSWWERLENRDRGSKQTFDRNLLSIVDWCAEPFREIACFALNSQIAIVILPGTAFQVDPFANFPIRKGRANTHTHMYRDILIQMFMRMYMDMHKSYVYVFVCISMLLVCCNVMRKNPFCELLLEVQMTAAAAAVSQEICPFGRALTPGGIMVRKQISRAGNASLRQRK